jgi:hypothetical protein
VAFFRHYLAQVCRCDLASPALGSPSPPKHPEIPRFQWQAEQHDCHTRKRTAATFTLPVLDALPDVAMVRIGFGSHSQTFARTFRRHKAGKPVHVTMPAGSLRSVFRQRPYRRYCTSRNRPRLTSSLTLTMVEYSLRAIPNVARTRTNHPWQ